MDRSCPPLLQRPLPCHHLPLVGATLRQHLRLATWLEHSRLRLLRLRVHHLDGMCAADFPPVLLGAELGNASMSRHTRGAALDQPDRHCVCRENQKRRGTARPCERGLGYAHGGMVHPDRSRGRLG